MRRIFLKLLHIYIIVSSGNKYGASSVHIRDNYYSRILQNRYFIRDYIIKKRYKVIEYRLEFQQELTFVLPFAYWHYLNGTLEKTVGCKYTKELYFFSKNHEERFEKRLSRLPRKKFEYPNMFHCRSFSQSKWARVPLKEHYQNNVLVFDKPILIIANKYNTEWGGKPVNYFSIPMLMDIISAYKEKYQIIYNRPSAAHITMDNSDVLNLNEIKYIRERQPDVLLAGDLYKKHCSLANNYNHFQLMLYANCNHFLSVHGGTAALASYFGGTNIIFSRQGREHIFKEFETVFPALSGARVLHAKEEQDVFAYLKEYY
ncbi:hypothetical protein [Pontibacter pamirensis]|uniref:hypothetical protein n=1 Tax=Pontibacter pamirensis TaxID=2562824 RepID=UPI001389EF80|nr:hypothetical protein [Pontibacter pamirensis]